MNAFPVIIRENSIKLYNDEDIPEEYKIVTDKFFKYLIAYCTEMKFTELDVLLDDDHYEIVFNLFENVVLKDKVFV